MTAWIIPDMRIVFCAECGGRVLAERLSRANKYCSPECRRRAIRSRHSVVIVCVLCGEWREKLRSSVRGPHCSLRCAQIDRRWQERLHAG